MRTVYRLTALVLIVGLLGGCVQPYVAPPPDPYPYSFTDTSKEIYPDTVEGARRFISDARTLWHYEDNNIVLQPSFCAEYFRGDCDDFATMLAYYLQEYWGYDTYIVFIRDTRYNVPDHAVTFFAPNNGVVDLGYCTNRPIITDNGSEYYPVDWTECPGWIWYNFGGTKYYTPAAWIYSYYLHDWYPCRAGGFLEWYEMVHADLSDLPPEESANSFDGPLPTPAVIA